MIDSRRTRSSFYDRGQRRSFCDLLAECDEKVLTESLAWTGALNMALVTSLGEGWAPTAAHYIAMIPIMVVDHCRYAYTSDPTRELTKGLVFGITCNGGDIYQTV